MQILAEPLVSPSNIIEEKEIPSDRALVTPLVVRIIDLLIEQKCLDPKNKMKAQLCLDEAITNAIAHGNNSEFDKMVKVEIFRDDDSWGTIVRDEGEGFDIEDIVKNCQDDAIWQEDGRGLPLMELYMDEVVYYDGGSTLFMRQFIK